MRAIGGVGQAGKTHWEAVRRAMMIADPARGVEPGIRWAAVAEVVRGVCGGEAQKAAPSARRSAPELGHGAIPGDQVIPANRHRRC